MKNEDIDVTNVIICDRCINDYSNSDEKGGLVFAGRIYCPRCAPAMLEQIKKHGEEENINGICPKGVSFRNFIKDIRAAGII